MQVEQLELIRLGAAVLWRIHHSRYPPTALLHSQLAFDVALDQTGLSTNHMSGGAAFTGPVGPRRLICLAQADEADELDDEAGDSDCGALADEEGGEDGSCSMPVWILGQ